MTTMQFVDAHVLQLLAAVTVASVYFVRVLNVLTYLNWQLCLMIRTLESSASAVVNDLVHVQVLSMLSFDLSFLLSLSPKQMEQFNNWCLNKNDATFFFSSSSSNRCIDIPSTILPFSTVQKADNIVRSLHLYTWIRLLFAVQQTVRLLISQLDVLKGGPEIDSESMMNRQRGPPAMRLAHIKMIGKRRKKETKNITKKKKLITTLSRVRVRVRITISFICTFYRCFEMEIDFCPESQKSRKMITHLLMNLTVDKKKKKTNENSSISIFFCCIATMFGCE